MPMRLLNLLRHLRGPALGARMALVACSLCMVVLVSPCSAQDLSLPTATCDCVRGVTSTSEIELTGLLSQFTPILSAERVVKVNGRRLTRDTIKSVLQTMGTFETTSVEICRSHEEHRAIAVSLGRNEFDHFPVDSDLSWWNTFVALRVTEQQRLVITQACHEAREYFHQRLEEEHVRVLKPEDWHSVEKIGKEAMQKVQLVLERTLSKSQLKQLDMLGSV